MMTTHIYHKSSPRFWKPLRSWIDRIDINSSAQAHWLCRCIPSQCPFERDLVWFGHTIAHIPPLCHLNPVYDELMGLRFRALSYLAERGERISDYIH